MFSRRYTQKKIRRSTQKNQRESANLFCENQREIYVSRTISKHLFSKISIETNKK